VRSPDKGIMSSGLAGAVQIFGAGRGDLTFEVDVVFNRQPQAAAIIKQRMILDEGMLAGLSGVMILH